MLSNTIKEHLRAMSFESFVIRMNDGRQFQVRHPDFAAVSPKGGSILVFGENDGAIHLSALLVVSVEPENSEPVK